jgi:D-alanine-D-alanine ligase
VSLWGNGTIEMLPPAEMDFSQFKDVHDRLCTYESKFVPGSRHYEGIHTLLPAPLSPKEMRLLREVCRAAYRTIGCRDYGRIDIRIRDGVFHVLDVNPNADISADASLACAAEMAGYSYGETGSRIIRLAAKRHPAWRMA